MSATRPAALMNPLSSQPQTSPLSQPTNQPINQPNPLPPQSQPQSINQSMTQLSINQSINQSTRFSQLDRPLPFKSQKEVPVTTFVYLFNELINQSIKRSDRIIEIEKKLNEYGQFVGTRMLDMSYVQQAASQSNNQTSINPSITRPRSILSLLQHIHLNLWKTLFNKTCDGLEKSTETASEFYLYENSPVTNRFLSLPKEYSELNCASFNCGIIEGFAKSAGFECECAAHFNATAAQPMRSVYIIKFTDAVMKRETMQHPH